MIAHISSKLSVPIYKRNLEQVLGCKSLNRRTLKA